MKHFRWLSLFILVLLLSAWAPAPQVFSSGHKTVTALVTPPALKSPIGGILYKNTDLSMRWRPTLVWSNRGVENYRVQLSTSSLYSSPIPDATGYLAPGNIVIANNPTISFTLPDDLPGNARIYWRVKADGDGEKWSASAVFYTLPKAVTGGDISPRVDPIVGGIAQAQAIRPTFRWDKSENVRSYVLRLASDDLCSVALKTFTVSFTTVALTPDVIEYTPLADLLLNKTYTWCVQSKGLTLPSDWSAPLKFTTPAQFPPQPKILLTPKAGQVLTSYQPNFTWAPVIPTYTTGIHYSFQLATKPTFADDARITPPVDPGLDLEYLLNPSVTLTAPLDTGIYYWRVRSIDDNGLQSNWSPTFLFKTPATLIIRVWDSLFMDQGIEGAKISISSSTIPASPNNVTLAGGVFTLPVSPTGYRTIKITMPDYVTQAKTTTIYPGTTKILDFYMKKVPIRIVLKWGTAPYDLDAHLWLPWDKANDPDCALCYHIYPGHMGSLTNVPWAKLDRDAYGYTTSKTETITIINRYPGTYYYGVYSNYSGSFTGMSGVSVTIYVNNKASAPILLPPPPPPPQTVDGLWWYVFQIDGATGAITLTNPADAILTVDEANTTFPYEPTYGTALNKPR